MSFGTLVDGLVSYLGEQDAGNLQGDHYKLIANMGLQALSEEHAWECLRRRGVMKLLAPKSDGAVDLTQGSTTVVPNGTTFTWDHVGAELYPSNDSNRVYEIIGFDGTNLELAFPFQGTTGTDSDYRIRKNTYVFPMDVAHIHIAKTREQNQLQLGGGDFDQELWSARDDSEGTPSEFVIDGYTEFPLFESTGDFTNGSADVTNITNLAPELVYKTLRRAGDMAIYRIKSISGTTATLDRKYRGESDTGQDLEIQPAGSPEIRNVFSLPGYDMLQQYKYTAQHPWLTEDDEYPCFPARYYQLIYSFIYWQLLMDENEDVAQIQMAHNKYKHHFKRFVSRQTTVNPKLSMAVQLKARGYGRHHRFRPDASGFRWGR